MPLSSPYPWLLSVAPSPAGLLSGNQAGRAHFSAHIILSVITNEYESPSVCHTRRESGSGGRDGAGVPLWTGGVGCSCVTMLWWHVNKLVHYLFKWVANVWHLHTRTCSRKKVAPCTAPLYIVLGATKSAILKLSRLLTVVYSSRPSKF